MSVEIFFKKIEQKHRCTFVWFVMVLKKRYLIKTDNVCPLFIYIYFYGGLSWCLSFEMKKDCNDSEDVATSDKLVDRIW